MKRRLCKSIRCSLFIVSVKVSPVSPRFPSVCVCVGGWGRGVQRMGGGILKKTTHLLYRELFSPQNSLNAKSHMHNHFSDNSHACSNGCPLIRTFSIVHTGLALSSCLSHASHCPVFPKTQSAISPKHSAISPKVVYCFPRNSPLFPQM